MNTLRIVALLSLVVLSLGVSGCMSPQGKAERPYTPDEIARMSEKWMGANYHRLRQPEILDAMVERGLIRPQDKQKVASAVLEIGMSEHAILAVHGMPERSNFEWRDELIRSDNSHRVIYHYRRATYYLESGRITSINLTD